MGFWSGGASGNNGLQEISERLRADPLI